MGPIASTGTLMGGARRFPFTLVVTSRPLCFARLPVTSESPLRSCCNVTESNNQPASA